MNPGFPTREDQIHRRRERAEKGRFQVRNTGTDPVFSIFEVRSESGRVYRVQIRSLTSAENTCTCPDYLANLLGTCKHIEAVALKIRSRLGKRALEAARPTCAQVYLGYGEEVAVRASRPEGLPETVKKLFARHFDDGDVFRGDPALALPAFLEEVESLPPKDRATIQIADPVISHAQRLREDREDQRLLAWYRERVQRGDRTFDLLSKPLYPFQIKGLLHLAFRRRSLLADDMGLGKTVQALASSLLLKEIKGVERVLVICPASLKHQWAREIARFTSLPSRIIQGPLRKRRLLYEDPAFFTVVNYELVLRDAPLLERFQPHLVILDEAQRIRNWKTKTADAVKAIPSKYAFVLTGTPLENRLDDLYSIF
ncbi:MAG: DEAD/DEAH box helicase, partial [Planctomycetota bacterium]